MPKGPYRLFLCAQCDENRFAPANPKRERGNFVAEVVKAFENFTRCGAPPRNAVLERLCRLSVYE